MTLIPLRRLRPAPAPAPPSGPPLVDPQARAVKYLRVSLTDHCNFRCTYCMPEAGVEQVARRELLTLAEVVLVVRAFAAWGVERVRLTGGEPTVRQGLVEQIRLAVARESEQQNWQFKTEDFKEGVAHFVEKRAPKFTGR